MQIVAQTFSLSNENNTYSELPLVCDAIFSKAQSQAEVCANQNKTPGMSAGCLRNCNSLFRLTVSSAGDFPLASSRYPTTGRSVNKFAFHAESVCANRHQRAGCNRAVSPR